MQVVLGCDVGGTAVKYGLFTTDGELIAKNSSPTPELNNEEGYRFLIDLFEQVVHENGATVADIVGVGFDTPGAVLADGTHILSHNVAMNIAGLRAAIEAEFSSAATAVLNDANAATFGEMWRGAAIGVENFCMITLGTGLGVGIVVDGRVVAGAHGCGGEAGHMCVNPYETRACGCGRHGCAEQYASAPWIIKNYEMECEAAGATPVDCSSGAKAVFDAYEAGDSAAKEAISQLCDGLGLCLANISTVNDPELFLLGGGVSAGYDLFIDELREVFAEHAVEACRETPILPATLGNDAGIYGAAFEALRVGHEVAA